MFSSLSALLISFLLLIILFISTKIAKAEKKLKFNFSMVLFCVFIICTSYISQIVFLEFFDIESIYFEYISQISLCFLPIFLVKTAINFVRPEFKFSKKFLLLYIIPIISSVIIITNNSHNLFFESTSYFVNLYNTGPYFKFSFAYGFLLILFSLILFMQQTIKATGLFSSQSLILLISVAGPTFLYSLGLLEAITYSVYMLPISFAISSAFLCFSIFNLQFLGIAPIALRYIVDNISDSYLVLNSSNQIVDFNKPFLDTFDVKAYNVRNVNLFDFLGHYTIKNLSSSKLQETLKSIKINTPRITKQIEIIELNKFFSIEITDISSKNYYLGTLILFKDISQHKEDMIIIKENQEKLMEREHLASLGQTIGGIAHNLKTPIMSISGAAEGITELTKEFDLSIDDPEVTSSDMHEIVSDMNVWIDKIKTHLSYMSDVITAVKGQAVALGNNQSFPFSISDLFKQVKILMKHELSQARIELAITNNVSDDTKINGNINALTQVINNIISNAIYAYTNSKITNEKIELIASLDKDNIIITIRDFGPGLSDNVKKKLFKEMITTKGKEGSGLGLYMSYSTIKAHFSGNIKFETKKDKGTTFNIFIPYKKISK